MRYEQELREARTAYVMYVTRKLCSCVLFFDFQGYVPYRPPGSLQTRTEKMCIENPDCSPTIRQLQ